LVKPFYGSCFHIEIPQKTLCINHELFMLKGDTDSVSSITRDSKKKEGLIL